MTQQAHEHVVLGQIAGVYGVRGWVKVYSHTDPKENILDYPVWLIGPDYQPVTLETGKVHGKGIIAKLAGYDDRDKVAVLLGKDIATTRDQLPAIEQGEYYWADLVGLQVVNTDKVSFGNIDHLFETGANAVMVVKDGKKERMVPFLTGSVIKSVDMEAGLVTVDWPEDF